MKSTLRFIGIFILFMTIILGLYGLYFALHDILIKP